MEPCIQEKTIERLEKATDKLFLIVEGNGQNGLNTNVAVLNKQIEWLIQRIDDLPTPNKLKAYAFFGAGSVAFLCFVGVIVYKILG